MLYRLPFFLRISILVCRLLSGIIAGLHYWLVHIGVLKIPLCVRNAPGGVYNALRNIWLNRLFRRLVSILVRSPLRNKTLRLIDFVPPLSDSGCVIIACHTPWARLIVQWCLKNDFALIITANKSNRNANTIKKAGRGFKDMRLLQQHLSAGGRIIVMGDVFNNLNNCPVHFFEKGCNASLLPARLAAITNVPLIAVTPELRKGAIHINKGPQLDSKEINSDPCAAIKNCLNFFEKEIRRNPSIWSVFVCGSLSKYQNKILTTAILNKTGDNKQAPAF